MEFLKKKIYILYLINFFMAVSVAIALFISLYYITPVNYDVITEHNYNIKEKKVDRIVEIKKDSTFKINYEDIQDYNLVFDKSIELIFSNVLKSQSVYYKKNTVIKSYNSDIIIVNTCGKDIKVGIKYLLTN